MYVREYHLYRRYICLKFDAKTHAGRRTSAERTRVSNVHTHSSQHSPSLSRSLFLYLSDKHMRLVAAASLVTIRFQAFNVMTKILWFFSGSIFNSSK